MGRIGNHKTSEMAKISVHPTFRTLLKTRASMENKSIIDLTKEIASKQSLLEEEKSVVYEKRRPFNFRI